MWTHVPVEGSRDVDHSHYRVGVSDFGEKGTCESCGTPDEIVHRVQREYFSTEPGGESTLLPDVEKWCYACCTHYPHRMLD
jgi:hypothetical protein